MGCWCYLVHRLVLRYDGKEAAGLAALLTVASPAVTINAFSFYSMNAHLVCNTAFLFCFYCGLPCRGHCSQCDRLTGAGPAQPGTAPAVRGPLANLALGASDRFRVVPALAAGYLPLSVALGFGWPQLISQLPWAPHLTRLCRCRQAFIVGSGRLMQTFRAAGARLARGPADGLAKLWLWAAPGLLLLAVCGRAQASDVRYRLIAWSAVTTLLGFLFVPFDQGHGWGFRYFHSVWFALPVLAFAV